VAFAIAWVAGSAAACSRGPLIVVLFLIVYSLVFITVAWIWRRLDLDTKIKEFVYRNLAPQAFKITDGILGGILEILTVTILAVTFLPLFTDSTASYPGGPLGLIASTLGLPRGGLLGPLIGAPDVIGLPGQILNMTGPAPSCPAGTSAPWWIVLALPGTFLLFVALAVAFDPILYFDRLLVRWRPRYVVLGSRAGYSSYGREVACADCAGIGVYKLRKWWLLGACCFTCRGSGDSRAPESISVVRVSVGILNCFVAINLAAALSIIFARL
jgi:hypothetical protein